MLQALVPFFVGLFGGIYNLSAIEILKTYSALIVVALFVFAILCVVATNQAVDRANSNNRQRKHYSKTRRRLFLAGVYTALPQRWQLLIFLIYYHYCFCCCCCFWLEFITCRCWCMTCLYIYISHIYCKCLGICLCIALISHSTAFVYFPSWWQRCFLQFHSFDFYPNVNMQIMVSMKRGASYAGLQEASNCWGRWSHQQHQYYVNAPTKVVVL